MSWFLGDGRPCPCCAQCLQVHRIGILYLLSYHVDASLVWPILAGYYLANGLLGGVVVRESDL